MANSVLQPAAPDPADSPVASASSGRKFVLLAAVFVLCTAWIIGTRLRTANEPLDRDICTQIMMGRVLADGGRMYVDTLEFKPPGMFVIWQVIHEVCGTGPRVVLVVGIGVALLSMIGAFWAGSAKPWGRAGGLWAMTFWTLISGDLMLQADQPSNEVFINLFMIWAVAFWVRAQQARRQTLHFIAAGTFLGLATLIKPILTTVAFMVIAWLFADGFRRPGLKPRLRAMIWLLLPLAVQWSLMVGYFVATGRARAFTDCVVRYAVFYSQTHGGITNEEHFAFWLNLGEGLTTKLIPSYMVFLVPLMILTALGLYHGLRARQRSPAFLLAGSVGGTLLAVSTPGTFYHHYYQLYLPLLAIGAAWGLAAWSAVPRWRRLASWTGVATGLLLVAHVAPLYRFDGPTLSLMKYPQLHGTFRECERCGHQVDRLLTPDESFYVWGIDPGVYYYSDRQPASGIFWADRLLVGPLKEIATRKVLADLDKARPSLILIETYLFPPADHPVYRWIQARYDPMPQAQFSGIFKSYIRRGSRLAARIGASPGPLALTLPEVDPDYLRVGFQVFYQRGQERKALAYLNRARELDPGLPGDEKDLAWILATSPDAALRNGPRAVALARHACESTGCRQINFVMTLAAAYAEAGDFDHAIVAARKACQLATAQEKPQPLEWCRQLLALFENHQPYHCLAGSPAETPASTAATPVKGGP